MMRFTRGSNVFTTAAALGLLLGVLLAVGWNRRQPVDWEGTRAVTPRQQEPQPQNRNCVIVGAPGSGKSTFVERRIVELAKQNDRFLLVQDPHGGLVDSVHFQLVQCGLEDRTEVLDLSYPQCVFGVDLMPYPEAQDRGKWLQQEQQLVYAFAQIMTRDRSNFSLKDAPMANTWIPNLLRLRMRQRVRQNLRVVPYALIADHPLQEMLFQSTWDDKLRRAWREVFSIKNVFQRGTILGSTERLVNPVFEDPCVDAILGVPPTPWDHFMQQKKIVLVKANHEVAEPATRIVMGALNLLTYNTAALHFARTGQPLLADIFADEALRLHVGAVEADKAEQGRKWGVAATWLVQRIPDEEGFQTLLKSIAELVIFQQPDYDAAEMAAREILARTFCSTAVKNVERRERTIHRGVEHREEKTKTVRKDKHGHEQGVIEGTRLVATPVIDTVMDETKQFKSDRDQLLEILSKVVGLGNGEHLIVRGSTASEKPQKIVKLEARCSDSQKRQLIQDSLARIRARPHFHRPTYEPPTVPAVPQPPPSREAPPASSPATPRAGRGMRRS